MKSKLFFRADGNEKIGLGHIVRCLSIIQMLGDRFECLLVVNNVNDKIKNLIKEVCDFVDLETIDLINEIDKLRYLVRKNDIMIIDGYYFNLSYQTELKKIAKKLVAIDDLSSNIFAADVIINHGDISVLPEYRTLNDSKIFSGLDYIIVRPNFIKAVFLKKNVISINTVFVCMGGADSFNITTKVIEACSQCDFIKKIIVVIGSIYNYKLELNSLLSEINNISIELFENASAIQMVEFIEQSQIAISTASTISLEICCVKSALICGTVVDNQNAIHSHLIKNRCCVSIGDWKKNSVADIKSAICALNDVQAVQKIIDAQIKSIDGLSSNRILDIFKNLAA